MKAITKYLLKSIPDWENWENVFKWINQGRKAATKFSKDLVKFSTVIELGWSDIQDSKENLIFGYYSYEAWRKFVLAAFLADLISYSLPIDQVNFDRLVFLMHAFPQGFRIWWLKVAEDLYWPAGYTGWYPMSPTTFHFFEKFPEKLKDRMVVPFTMSENAENYIYLFNYSVAPNLKKSYLSQEMMKKYSQDILSKSAEGLACITVSEDGARIASRFGMSCYGSFELSGYKEGVYIRNNAVNH